MGAPAAWHKNPFLPAANTQCWIFVVPGNASKPRDPSELPHSEPMHRVRIEQKIYGSKAYQLCPAIMMRDLGEKNLVQVRTTKDGQNIVLKVKAGLVLDWFEGLLLLDAMQRTPSAQKACDWYEGLQGILAKEKARRNLLASIYVTQKLLNAAVTGPLFPSWDGKEFYHRRTPLRKDPPAEVPGPPPAGFYKVDRLLEYLPPWESFVNPRCGLYQDFYLVLWAGPQPKESYASWPNGCEAQPHATWEPDECLPDELDTMRVACKKRWLDAQREKEKTLSRQGSGEEEGSSGTKRSAEEAGLPDGQPRPAKYFPDICERTVQHAFTSDVDIVLEDNSKIKSGWPKRIDEYPGGYSAVEPPGYCMDACTCMEDWHLGELKDPSLSWLSNPVSDRVLASTTQMFRNNQDIHRERGTVSNQCYFEPPLLSAEEIARLHEGGKRLLAFSKSIRTEMREAGSPLPLNAVMESGAEDILSSLLQAYLTVPTGEGSGPFQPLTFEKQEGPEWLSVQRSTGRVSVNRSMVREAKGESLPLVLVLSRMADNNQVSPDLRVDLKLHVTHPAIPPKLETITGKLMDQFRQQKASFQTTLRELVQEVYDFDERSLKSVSLAQWMRVMKNLSVATQAASSCKVIR
eukprot:TRINITY_DN5551_c0_g1_i2.p1 TRINITY_DN5551_c0_g1~~TRINITY_DN5551_c0_g1_i2.p1  ORF type:complete len:631 (-),score=114.70 TRINITY_DN5551_c0_g1_i2:6-1898(-)